MKRNMSKKCKRSVNGCKNSINYMLFAVIMNRKPAYLFVVVLFLMLFTWMFSCSGNESKDDFSEQVKVSLRNVGHQLLLISKDSTSLILPVIEIDKSKYKLSFQNQLSFEPENLVAIIKSSFNKANIPNNYRVEVFNCVDKEVAYSYEMQLNEEKSIIPCAGRFLPKGCYTIEVKFTDRLTSNYNKKIFLYISIFSVLVFLLLFFNKRKQTNPTEDDNSTYASIGSFRFYPEQNKLVKAAVEISLSKKECELLEIFAANPNQIIKREDLMKQVWEDNGVFVGRSLDTYISKLRKKLQDDTSIKLTNVHGVGYKLEVNY
ncbi:MAG: winged helix-turn-helix domain-containing protein [Flavobacteriaceae bacterium]|nr:winged helix-turn-helix domain-containing protein [Flavobacteriaceae bacterium]